MLRLALLLLLVLGCSRPQADAANDAPPVIPGMESGILRTGLERRGLSCVGPQQFEQWVTWECSGTEDAARYVLVMRGLNASRILSVDATVLQSGPDDAVTAEFLGYVATIPYEGARPEEARAWVQSQVGASESARKAFGAAMYALSGPPESRSLTITPSLP